MRAGQKLENMSGQIERTRRPTGTPIDVSELKRRSWPGFTVEHVRIPAHTEFAFRLPSLTSHVCLLDVYRADGETVSSEARRSTLKDLRNKLTFSPVDCDVGGWCKVEKSATVTSIGFHLPDEGATSVDLTQLPPRIEFEDQMLRWSMLRLHTILTDPVHDTAGYAETVVELLSFDLIRIASGAQRRSLDGSGLSASQIRLVIDYMESHLDEKTTIAELAKLVDLTRFHFIRSFKQSVGVPPHQFMIQRRVERAKEMLTGRSHSIADVAAQTGFNSSIQLSRAFRRVVGVTPSEFRRSAG
jgi:AraC family transcriptional regulator